MNSYEPLFMANDLGNELLNSVEIFSLAKTCLSQYYSLVDSSRSYLISPLLKNSGSQA